MNSCNLSIDREEAHLMKRSDAPSLFAPTFPRVEKPLLVFFPGLDGTGKLFSTQIESLTHHFDLRCLNLPESNRQGWEGLTRTVIDLIRQEQQNSRPTYVCGESFGGCLALKIALTAPDILDRLVVINPASALQRQYWLRWAAQTAAYVPEWIYTLSGALALPLLANFARINPEQQHLFINTVRPISQACVTWRLTMLRQFELSLETVRHLTIPTALIASGRDRLFPSYEEVALLQQYLPDAISYFLPDSGHVCLLEADVDLAACLAAMDFLPTPSAVPR
jgi:pimeloyl-ACP methyl ester carboxylesterase